ncbi:LiaF transmembrane domain-containing protein [Virgibacillus sp. W0181]|uniref:LiaF transmembrane domain-containing protein n=1 Tax=Virgibacillus sp. W0181 TaxID=3391581 RepID=UPI003F485240
MLGRFWIGLILILFGVGFLLQQADMWDFFSVFSTWWPLILIGVGIIQLTNRAISGLLAIGIGGLFLVNQWVDVNLLAYLWPLILILVGLVFIFSRNSHVKNSLHSDRSIQSLSLFSGTEIKSQSQQFEGGNVTAIFGGAEIDLRDTAISSSGAALDLTALFGGIEIRVPENVRIEVTGMPIFGGWENKTRQTVDKDDNLPLLRIKCVAAFGGVEIRN